MPEIGLTISHYKIPKRKGKRLMAKQDLKNLGTNELQRKKTIATVLLWILFGVGLLSIGVGAIRGRHELFATPAVLFAVGYPMYAGMKKVEAELRRREDK